MIGTTLGRYRIVAKLGEGGMGSVWRAEDALLGRTVALKLLAPELAASDESRDRFLREARSASRLEHPGIAAVHDVGEAGGQVFIAYQFIEGVTLAATISGRGARLEQPSEAESETPDATSRGGPLPLASLVRLALGTARALAHAHVRGVLHRDLSAANIMLRPDGEPVIVDFGLARALGDVTLTRTGTSLGTVAYMAPEQWRGEPAGERSDLWSLGVSLYFAATGSLPFPGESAEAVMYRALQHDPERPSTRRATNAVVGPSKVAADRVPNAARDSETLPTGLERVILRLLEKDPRDRLPSADALVAELESIASASEGAPAPSAAATDSVGARFARWWRRQSRRRFGPAQLALAALLLLAVVAGTLYLRARVSSSRTRVLAVLPFRTTGGDVSEGVVAAEALGEELVGRLGSVNRFRVLPWATTGPGVPAGTSLASFARDIGADILLTGTIQATEERIRVHAEAIDGSSGTQLWSEELVRPAGDLIGLQTALVTSAALRLAGRLDRAQRERLERAAPGNPEAYDYFIRGSAYFHSIEPSEQALAEAHFQKAAELDTTLAGALVGLGAIHTDRYFRGDGGDQRDLRAADSLFRRALLFRPGLPVAERGLIRVISEGASRENNLRLLEIADAALARDPNDVEQLTTAAWGFTTGCMAELAIPLLERALRLDPGNQGLAWYRVFALCWAGYPARSLAAGKDYIRRFGEDVEVYCWLGVSAVFLGRVEEGFEYLDRSRAMNRNAPAHYAALDVAILFHDLGDTARSRQVLREILPMLETSAAAAPGNRRLMDNLAQCHALLGDYGRYQSTIALAHRALGETTFDIGWSRLARAGLVGDAIRRASGRDSLAWYNMVDSIGAKRPPVPANVLRVMSDPAFLRSQAAIDACQQRVFDHYRERVAAALGDDPDVPARRTQFPPRAPYE